MVTRERMAGMYRQMLTIRLFETTCIQLYRQGEIRGYFHPYLGEEAVAVGACAALEPHDYIVSTHRGHGHCIAKGARVDAMIAELLGRLGGYCRGRGGSMHIADVATGNLGANGIVAGGVPIGLGAGLASRLRGDGRVVVIFTSDGAFHNGVFAESLNMAALWHLPVVFMVENNRYAAATPLEAASANVELHQAGGFYRIDSHAIDGNDMLEVQRTSRAAVERCRGGQGPVLIEARTYRHGGHHVNDPGTYMPQDRLEHYRGEGDPLRIARAHLAKVLDEPGIAALEQEVRAEIEAAVAFARESPEPDPQAFLRELEEGA